LNYRAYSLTLISLILSLYIVPPAFSQVSGDEKPPPAEAEIKAPETKQPEAEALKSKAEEPLSAQPQQQQAMPEKPAEPQKASPTVSFFFDDADIFEVVQTIFADVLKVNYIIDPQVKGRVNFRTVTPIPKDQVLSVMEIIFRLNGIGFVEESGLYRIIPLSEVPKELVYSQIGKVPEKVAIEMFTFKNLELKEAMPDIENALGLQLQGGTVRILPIFRMNALIVVASSQQQLDYIRQWIGVFDKMFAVAKPKIFVYPLQNSKAEHIASLLQSIFSGTAPSPSPSPSPSQTSPAPAKTTGTVPAQPQSAVPKTGASTAVSGGGGFVSPETRAFADEITNSLIILATPTDYSFIEDTLKKIDIMPRQVVIEGLIAQVVLTDNMDFGLSWIMQNINIKNLNGDMTSLPTGPPATGLALPNTVGKGFTFVATDPTGSVRAKLTAALLNSKGKILAAPHVLVADNREARIQVGSQIPLATSSTTYVAGTTSDNTIPTTSTIQYKDIGIILKVKPQINDSGLVSIELSQEISGAGITNTIIAGQQYPSIDKTEATTNLIAQDGETIIIGGLIREDKSKEIDGIPFLSKIPLIGNLFSSTSIKNNRTELIILLTPHVIKNEKEAGEVTADYMKRQKNTSQLIEEKSGNDEGFAQPEKRK